MKEYRVVVDFCQGVSMKKLYEGRYLILEESEEKAKAWVTNFLRLQNFYNFKIVSVEEVQND